MAHLAEAEPMNRFINAVTKINPIIKVIPVIPVLDRNFAPLTAKIVPRFVK